MVTKETTIRLIEVSNSTCDFYSILVNRIMIISL
jgi:hypothetical protein